MKSTCCGADGRAAAQLGQRAEVGLVGDGDRQRRPERVGQALAERDVAPAEVRRHRHDAGVAAHDADDRDADADHALGARAAGAARRARAPRGRRSVSSTEERSRGRSRRTTSRTSPPMPTAATASESTVISSARTMPPRGLGRTSGDGRPGVPCGVPRLLGDEAREGELADEPADRAARQAGPRHQLGARNGAAIVQLSQDCAEVRPPDGLTALSWQLVGHGEFVFLYYKMSPQHFHTADHPCQETTSVNSFRNFRGVATAARICHRGRKGAATRRGTPQKAGRGPQALLP